ncbi:hypothetical protein CLV63_1048 [Murinocardiopsis flavida]|uniref:Uncharacterized protein n=1 Tax=Murinocardiopsis flavida TaxID=645275 RepID=A0A2P8DNI6_9ACTN|nr:hypothetical protein [Murinocardiopsis flavida]PSK98784.1 hypothetical protein CLV63_1048 [Murinocardiopsis flavida]
MTEEAGKHTPASFTRLVVGKEAERRRTVVHWDMSVPDHVPGEIRHAVFHVADRGWCVWATTSDEEIVTPAERDFYPLDDVLPDRWSRVGWHGVRVPASTAAPR